MSDEWGPWIDHDGKSWPVRAGMVVNAVWIDGVEVVEVATGPGVAWFWHECDARGLPNWKIARYRVRKPCALEQLREIARNPERELEDA